MIHADVCTQLMTALYAQVREVLINHLKSPPKSDQAPPGIPSIEKIAADFN